MTQTRKHLFEYMNIEDRDQYIAHRHDFDKNVNVWKLTSELWQIFEQATEVAFDTETISEPPAGTYTHLTDSIRKNLGLTYLSEVTHAAFFTVVNGQEYAVLLVAPFTEKEFAFAEMCFSNDKQLSVTHNGVFDYRIFCGHHNLPLPKNTYCTFVGNTTMFGGPKGGYPGHYTRSLDSLMRAYGIMSTIRPYVIDAVLDWGKAKLEELVASGVLETEIKKGTVDFSIKMLKLLQVAYRANTDLFSSVEEIVWIEEWQRYMKAHRSVLHTLPAKWVAAYAISDSVGTFYTYKAQMYWSNILREDPWGYTRIMERHREEQAYQNVLNYWSIRGIPVNREWIQRQIEKIEEEEWRLIPYFVEMGCGDLSKENQKKRFIFDICQCAPPDPWEYVEFDSGYGKWYPADMQRELWTKGGREYIEENGWEDRDYSAWYATGTKAIKYYLKYGPVEHRSKLALYQYYTSMVSQKATYHEWLDHSSYDGSVHMQASASANTGRTITGTPNIQNVNMHQPQQLSVYDPDTGDVSTVTEFTGLGMIMPSPGKVLLEFDASNAEVRTGAVLARAKNLINMFANHVDMHRANAAAFYHKTFDEVTKQERGDGKSVFFGFQYGASPRSVASMHSVLQPMSVIAPMIKNWFATNYEVKQANERVQELGKKSYYRKMINFPLEMGRQAYTELWNGRWVPAPSYRNRPKLYALWNSQQQGGVGGIAMPAIIKSHQYFRDHPELGADILLMVHDSIIIEVPDDDWEAVQQAGTYVAQQLSTQMPFELTVVDGIGVPWPSGCDLYENKDKWGWRPDADFPYYCGEDEGDVVITFPEDQAWEVIKDKALVRLDKQLRALKRDINAHYASAPVKQLVWYDEETETYPCVDWQSTVQYSAEEHYTQSRYWGRILQLHNDSLDEGVKENLRCYRDWVDALYKLDMQFQTLREQYEYTKGWSAYEQKAGSGEAVD